MISRSIFDIEELEKVETEEAVKSSDVEKRTVYIIK